MTIEAKLIEDVAGNLMKKACCELPEDFMSLLRRAYEKETNEFAKQYLNTMIKTAEIGKKEKRPVCQDTGIPYYYVDIGSNVQIKGDIQSALEKATERATLETPMRANVVHPLKNINPGTNVGWGIPYAYYDFISGLDYIQISAIPKGGGGSLVSLFKIPSVLTKGTRIDAIKKAVIDHAINSRFGCPPHVYSVAIGGSPAYTVHLAAKTVWRRPVGSPNPEPEISQLEKELFEAINKTGIGPMNLSGDTTALAVHVEIRGSHTVSPSVAVAFNCWPYRIATAKIYNSGHVEEIIYKGEL